MPLNSDTSQQWWGHQTDIFMILLHHANNIPLTIYLDTGTGKHQKIINITELAETFGRDYCTTILCLYIFSGEDVTSTFKGKGKVGPLKKLQSYPKYHGTFSCRYSIIPDSIYETWCNVRSQWISVHVIIVFSKCWAMSGLQNLKWWQCSSHSPV